MIQRRIREPEKVALFSLLLVLALSLLPLLARSASMACSIGVQTGIQNREEDSVVPKLISDQPTDALPAGQDAKMQKLMAARVGFVRKELESRFRQCIAGQCSPEFLVDCASRMVRAKLELCQSSEQRLKVREQAFEFFEALEAIMQKRVLEGKTNEKYLWLLQYYRSDAQIALAQEKNRM